MITALNNPILNAVSLSAYELAYYRTPIILTNGVAKSMGGYMPISTLTEFVDIGNILQGLIAGSLPSLNDMWALFQVQGGTSLLNYSTGEYPFYNAQSAANSQFKNPNQISFLMLTPFKQSNSVLRQLPIMTLLIQTLERHQKLGGVYTLLTPSKIYTNAILESITQVDYEQENQIQMGWMWTFKTPLLTIDQAETAYNDAMDKIANKIPSSASDFFKGLF